MVRSLLAAVAVASLAACTSPGPRPTPLQGADQRFMAERARCSERFGFDPTQPGLPDRALAPGERAWVDCALTAMRDVLMPNSAVPERYQQLIEDYRRWTAELAAGRMARAERTARADAETDAIERAERDALAMQKLQEGSGEQAWQREVDRQAAITRNALRALEPARR